MKRLLAIAALSLALVGSAGADENRFGALEPMAAGAARAKAEAWLKEIGKTDPALLQRVEAIWKNNERTVLDRLADTIALGDEAAAKALSDSRDPLSPAPTQLPAAIKDAKNGFLKANLGLAYARNLINRRVHEEALDVLKQVKAEQVVDPGAYLFNRAVAEHALLNKMEALKSIGRLLDDASGAPERYKTVSALMLLDMQTWKDKDLASIARKMGNIERRLELARGGPQTQKQQKEVILRLDELIKELENKAKQQQKEPKDGEGKPGDPNGGSCPDGSGPPMPGQGPPKGNDPSSPATESGLPSAPPKSGIVDQANLKKLTDNWGQMPPRERIRALQELTQGMSARHREAIENYFRNLAENKK